jgi:hypothetical protein
LGAIEIAADNNFRTYPIVRRLVLNLGDDDDVRVRSESFKTLKRWGGTGTPDYEADAKEEDRKGACDDWKSWLDKNKDRFEETK